MYVLWYNISKELYPSRREPTFVVDVLNCVFSLLEVIIILKNVKKANVEQFKCWSRTKLKLNVGAGLNVNQHNIELPRNLFFACLNTSVSNLL